MASSLCWFNAVEASKMLSKRIKQTNIVIYDGCSFCLDSRANIVPASV